MDVFDELAEELSQRRVLLDEAFAAVERHIDQAEYALINGDSEATRLTVFIRELYQEKCAIERQLGRLDQREDDLAMKRDQEARSRGAADDLKERNEALNHDDQSAYLDRLTGRAVPLRQTEPEPERSRSRDDDWLDGLTNKDR